MDYYIGMLGIFGFAWAPQDFALCDGTLMQINQNQALYSLLGTLYGGNGSVTFGIPDLRGRVIIGQSTNQAPVYQVGANGGTLQTTLTTNNLPAHNHAAQFTPTGGGGPVTVQASTDPAESAAPSAGSMLAGFQPPNVGPTQYKMYRTSASSNMVSLGGVSGGGITGGTVTVGMTGSGQPFTNMQPYLTMNPCICTVGLYPMRP
ncbi:phage tail protein [Novispirillum sp. DQ9]|uniref:phage tail protein n=1 Tax=Novispirillum sp. DQ9 TaxID=3398612 RepID=UPI003C797315